MRRLSAGSALLLILVGFAARADPQGLSTGVPVQIEDALPVRLGGLQLQGAALFTHDTRNRRGSDLCALNPSVKLGPLPELQIDATPSYSIGDQSGAGSGNGAISALYQLTRNSTYVPALALHGYYATPYGSGHKSAWFKARSHGEAGLALAGRMMAPSRFQRWCKYGSRCWRSSEAARE